MLNLSRVDPFLPMPPHLLDRYFLLVQLAARQRLVRGMQLLATN
jgi:hypothetical protein